VLPLPSSLLAQTFPPWRSAIDFTIAKPKPDPLSLLASLCALLKNLSNKRGWSIAETPIS